MPEEMPCVLKDVMYKEMMCYDMFCSCKILYHMLPNIDSRTFKKCLLLGGGHNIINGVKSKEM